MSGSGAEIALRLFIPVTLTLIVTGFALRMYLRHFSRSLREARIGELVWYEIIREGRLTSSTGNATIESQVSSIKGLISALERGSWPYLNRGCVSIVWQKDPDNVDGLLKMYVGVDKSRTESGSNVVGALAAGLNARAKEIDGPPPISAKGMVVAHRSTFSPSEIEKHPASIGTAARVLSEARDLSGTVIMTLDPIRDSEGHRFESNFNEEGIMRGGEVNKMSDLGQRSRIILASPVRASIAAVSHSGRVSSSASLLNLVVGHISTLGFKYDVRDAVRHFHKLSLWYLIPYVIVMTLLTMAGLIPWYVSVVLSSPALTMLVLNFMNSPLVALKWFDIWAKKGQIVVPSFVWWNPRWRIHAWVRSLRTNAGGDELVKNKVAPPSCKQVLTLYPSPIAEFVTVASDHKAGITDVAQERVPLIGLPSNFEFRDKWDIFVGHSGSGQVVSIPLSDINHGLFAAGAPESGKTNLLHVIYSGMAKASQHPDETGLQITPIWAESSKGVGAYDAWSLVQDDPRSVFIDAHNPNSGYRLCLEGRRLSEGATVEEVVYNINALVGGFQFAWGESIKDSSREALYYSILIAMLLEPKEIRYCEIEHLINVEKPNVIKLAWMILGGDPNNHPGAKLLTMNKELHASREKGEQLTRREQLLLEALTTIGRYLDPKNTKVEDRRLAPLNKLSALYTAEDFWQPREGVIDVEVSQIVGHFAPIVLNMGPYWSPAKNKYEAALNASEARRLLLIANYAMWGYVRDNCTGWGDMGKRVPVFFDEVSDVAVDSQSSDSYNVLAKVSSEGRSRGFSYICGGQNLAQLPYQAKHEVMSWRSKVFCELPNTDDARRVMDDIGNNTAYSIDNIKNIPLGLSVASLKQKLDKTPWFTLQIPYVKMWGEHLKVAEDVDEAIKLFEEEMNSLT